MGFRAVNYESTVVKVEMLPVKHFAVTDTFSL
jgi:hypothetical protein